MARNRAKLAYSRVTLWTYTVVARSWPRRLMSPANFTRSSRRRNKQFHMKPARSRSHEAFERARKVIPGGVNSPARAFGGVGGQPIFIARGEGPHLYDIDGNRYLD